MKRSVRASRLAKLHISSSEDGSSESEIELDGKYPVIIVPDSPASLPSPSLSADLHYNTRHAGKPTSFVPKNERRNKKQTPSKGLSGPSTSPNTPQTPYSMRARDKHHSTSHHYIPTSRMEVDALHHSERAQAKLENLIRHKHIVDLQRTLDSDESVDISAAAAPNSLWSADFGGTCSTDSTPEKDTTFKSKLGRPPAKSNGKAHTEANGLSGKTEVAEEDKSIFGLVEAPVFYPTAEEFADPTSFLDRIQPIVEPFGICRIVPPKEWNRDVWKSQINPSTFSFNTKSQSVHYLQRRNGEYTQFMVKLQYFWTNVARFPLEKLPEIDGTPVDLYALHCAVRDAGGADALKGKWNTLLPLLHINPDATYGDSNLTQIYRKVLVPFEEHLASNHDLPRYKSSYPETTHLETQGEEPRRNGDAKRSARHTRHTLASNREPGSHPEPMDDVKARPKHKRAKLDEAPIEYANVADELDGPVSDSVLRALMKLRDDDPTATYGAYGKLEEEVSAAKAGRWRSVRAMSFVPEQDASFVFCFYCRKGDKPSTLVLCDSPGCSGGAHLRCMNPPMTRPPHGKYFCPSCKGETHPHESSNSLPSPIEEKPAFHVVDSHGREVSGLDLSANLGFGHAPGRRYTLAEFKEMAMKFATFWFGKTLNSFADTPIGSPPKTPASSPAPALSTPAGSSKANGSAKKEAGRATNGHSSPPPLLVPEPTTPSPVRSRRASTSLRNFSKDTMPPMVTSASEIETEYWKVVSSADRLLRVNYGSDVDVSYPGACSGFPLDVQGKTVGKDCPEVRRWELSPASDANKSSTLPRPDVNFLREHGWNLNSLPYVTLLRWLGESISGVTRPMLYIGMLFSSFCWHTEDNWLYSINYIHTGAPKRWYGVSGHHAETFETALKAELPHLFAAEPQILFQLTTVLHPEILKRHGVRLCTTLQKEGEFVVTFPRAYHSGFNCGFNVAESVNFATWRWLDWGLTAANQYRFVRSTVFAHEKFVWQAAINASRITHLPLLISVYRHLVLYVKFARATIQVLKQKGIVALYHSSRVHYDLSTDPSTGSSIIEARKVGKLKAEQDPAYVNLLDDGFEPEDPQCYVCGYDLYMHRVDCQCRSPRIPRCLKHGGQPICECAHSRKFVSYRFNPSSVRNILVHLEAVLTKMGAPPPTDERASTKRLKK